MKKITVGFSLLALATLLVTCKKEKNVAPEQDSETASAVEATWGLYAITDVEQMCAFMGEDQLGNHFYKQDLGVAGSGTVVATRDTGAKSLNMSFNNSSCADGRLRSGSVFMDYGYSTASWILPYYTQAGIAKDYKPRYYHEYGFLGRLTFSQYHVDGWTIVTDSLYDPGAGIDQHSQAVIYNNMGETDYNPATKPLKWKIKGNFVLYQPLSKQDSIANKPNKYMLINVDLEKTLKNSTDVKTFSATVNKKDAPITWSVGIVYYTGKVTGKTLSGEPFSMEFNESSPLTRDFTCFPDKVGSVSVGTGTQVLVPRFQEHHPFISGTASFTTSVGGKEQYPRKIYYGNEGNITLAAQCDNTGEVLIKGVSYRVNFWK